MISLLLAMAMTTAPADAQPIWHCTAEHYRTFVSPSGTTANWPLVAALPKQLADQRAMLLSTPGMLPGGMAYTMYVDAHAGKVYILQSGGTPNKQVVFGPLPSVACPAAAPASQSRSPS